MSKKRPTTRSNGHDRLATVQSGLSQQLGRIVFEALMRIGATGTDGAPLTVARAPISTAPARLASGQSVGPAKRQALRGMYETCLQAYRSGVRPQDAALAVDDAGAALAFFVAVNLKALHDCEVTSEVLQRLERQLNGVARLSSAWESASLVDRQVYFETLATIGMLVAGLLERAGTERRALEEVRRVARGYLLELLGIDPDLLTLDANGLALRTAQAEPQHLAA
jgi:hypothetical protein